PEPLNVMLPPAVGVPVTWTIASGPFAAVTAAPVFSMPAPQVCVVQLHSVFCMSVAEVGTWHTGTLPVAAGNGVADRLINAIVCAGVNELFTELINAAVAAAIGPEKLV